jgi:hypothetical protein
VVHSSVSRVSTGRLLPKASVGPKIPNRRFARSSAPWDGSACRARRTLRDMPGAL